MRKRNNYYKDLASDYSKPMFVLEELSKKLIAQLEKYMALREAKLPEITPEYNLEQIEKENKEWWPARCEAIRKGRGDLLGAESADNFVYLCQDGPFYGPTGGAKVVAGWSAIFFQPGATMIWPIVMFHGETIYFEWTVMDDETYEIIASGNVTFLRRGHKGGCYIKTEHLNFYRDVSGSA